jgi:hypothetical protein
LWLSPHREIILVCAGCFNAHLENVDDDSMTIR